MKLEQTKLEGLVVLTPRRFSDDRGFFSEVWNKETLRSNGIDVPFTQDNHSFSKDVGVLRGLHYQAPPKSQDKLIRVATGAILDVSVDVRPGSPTYGEWVGVVLSAENGKQLFVPKGFLHGFVTLTPDVHLLYKCSDTYSQECDGAVAFDDPDLGIDWGIEREDAILSQKDANAPKLADWDNPFSHQDYPSLAKNISSRPRLVALKA